MYSWAKAQSTTEFKEKSGSRLNFNPPSISGQFLPSINFHKAQRGDVRRPVQERRVVSVDYTIPDRKVYTRNGKLQSGESRIMSVLSMKDTRSGNAYKTNSNVANLMRLRVGHNLNGKVEVETNDKKANYNLQMWKPRMIFNAESGRFLDMSAVFNGNKLAPNYRGFQYDAKEKTLFKKMYLHEVVAKAYVKKDGKFVLHDKPVKFLTYNYKPKLEQADKELLMSLFLSSSQGIVEDTDDYYFSDVKSGVVYDWHPNGAGLDKILMRATLKHGKSIVNVMDKFDKFGKSDMKDCAILPLVEAFNKIIERKNMSEKRLDRRPFAWENMEQLLGRKIDNGITGKEFGILFSSVPELVQYCNVRIFDGFKRLCGYYKATVKEEVGISLCFENNHAYSLTKDEANHYAKHGASASGFILDYTEDDAICAVDCSRFAEFDDEMFADFKVLIFYNFGQNWQRVFYHFVRNEYPNQINANRKHNNIEYFENPRRLGQFVYMCNDYGIVREVGAKFNGVIRALYPKAKMDVYDFVRPQIRSINTLSVEFLKFLNPNMALMKSRVCHDVLELLVRFRPKAVRFRCERKTLAERDDDCSTSDDEEVDEEPTTKASIDIIKAHSNILRHNCNLIPRLNANSRLLKFCGSVETNAFYLITGLKFRSVHIETAFFTIEQTKFFLHNEFITHDNILGYIPYDTHFAPKSFTPFVEQVYELFDEKLAKRLVNNLVGFFGKHKKEKTESIITTSQEYANAMLLNYAKRGEMLVPQSLDNNLTLMSHTTSTAMTETYLPLQMLVVGQCVVELFKLDMKYGADAELAGANTDCVSYIRIKKSVLDDVDTDVYRLDTYHPYIGMPSPMSERQIKNEMKTALGVFEENLAATAEFVYDSEINDDDAMLQMALNKIKNGENFLATGNPRCGKSHLAKRLAKHLVKVEKKNVYITAITHEIVNQFSQFFEAEKLGDKADGSVIAGCLFDGEKGKKMKSVSQLMEKFSNVDVLIVDEISMLDFEKHYHQLAALKHHMADLRIVLVGDLNQLPCIAEEHMRTYDISYEKNYALQYMCDGNVFFMDVPHEGDEEIAKMLRAVHPTKTRGDDVFISGHMFSSRVSDGLHDNSISKFRVVNKDKPERVSTDSENQRICQKIYNLGDDWKKKARFIAGCKMICKTNNLKEQGLFNNTRCEFVREATACRRAQSETDDKGQDVVELRVFGKIVKVKRSTYSDITHNFFDYAYCNTIYAYQGSSIHTPTNLFMRGAFMTKRDAYTLFSRFHKYGDMRCDLALNETVRIRDDVYPNNSVLVEAQRDSTLRNGYIYAIHDAEKIVRYVGQTGNLSRRESEHRGGQHSATRSLCSKEVNFAVCHQSCFVSSSNYTYRLLNDLELVYIAKHLDSVVNTQLREDAAKMLKANYNEVVNRALDAEQIKGIQKIAYVSRMPVVKIGAMSDKSRPNLVQITTEHEGESRTKQKIAVKDATEHLREKHWNLTRRGFEVRYLKSIDALIANGVVDEKFRESDDVSMESSDDDSSDDESSDDE